MTLRGVSGRVAVDVVSGDVDISAIGEAAVTIKTVSGDVELRANTLTALDATTTSGDLRIAGRLAGPGPFAIVTVSGDTLLAPAGDVRIEMATLSGDIRSKIGGRTEGGRGRRSLVVGAGGPLVSLRSMSGDLLVVPPTPVRSRPSRPSPGAASPPEAPVAPGRPSAPRTRPSPPPMTTRGCGSCARSSAARSTSPRPASDSRRSMASIRSMSPRPADATRGRDHHWRGGRRRPRHRDRPVRPERHD